ncbi:DUF3348 domain-containing protein [Trinickia sp. LjRoot230]|uniref:DUF3348 domain-containing protein n=1 Tax=Trinickia sp. LjRoot230 TaxID=3342288 RepID=UPI003ECE349D
MVQVPQRTALSGPALIRLMSRLTNIDVPEPRQSLSEQLSQWLGWTDAITLSSALNGSQTARPAARDASVAHENACIQLRSALTKAIISQTTTAETTTDYAFFRHRYLAIQQTMETEIGDLRRRLRSKLATAAPATGMSRLAAVDAVMEQTLSARERTLLATLPELLARRFERMQQSDLPDSANWLDVFRLEMQSVLLAELDIRFQPVEGLLAALRTPN